MHEQRVETELMLAVPLQERRSSVASLRPVGLSVRSHDPDRTYEALSNEWDVSERRRRLARVVVGAVAVCAVILGAAGVRFVIGRASAASTPPPAAALQPAAESAGLAGAASEPAAAQAGADPRTSAQFAGGAPLKNAATMGMLVLEHPAAPGHVWLDGDRVTAESATIACGKHEIRVGPHGRAHPIDVPCGGSVRVSH